MIGEKVDFVGRDGMNCTLASPEMAGAVTMLTWASDKEMMDAMAAPDHEPLRDRATLETEQARVRDFANKRDTIIWAIRCDGKLVGQIWIDFDEDENNGRAGHLSYLIGNKSMRGRGLAAAVGQKVLEWAFEKGDFSALRAWCFTDNIASKKTLEKLRFIYDFRDTNDELVDGKYSERDHFIMTKTQWMQERGKA